MPNSGNEERKEAMSPTVLLHEGGGAFVPPQGPPGRYTDGNDRQRMSEALLNAEEAVEGTGCWSGFKRCVAPTTPVKAFVTGLGGGVGLGCAGSQAAGMIPVSESVAAVMGHPACVVTGCVAAGAGAVVGAVAVYRANRRK